MSLVFALGGTLAALAAFLYGQNAARKSYDRLLIGAAGQIAESISLQNGAPQVDLPLAAFQLLSLAPEDRVIYAVRDARGELITGYPEIEAPAEHSPYFNAEFAGEAIRVAHVRRRFAERSYSGSIDVMVGHTLRARQQLAGEITRNALYVVALAGLVMIGLAIFAVRSALGPLRRVESDLAARPPNDLTPLTVSVPSEISGLIHALNRFMARLQRQMTGMRNLIGDTSHQLRTPIAALQAQAELGAEETEPERLREIFERVHRRSRNLSRLADQLLNRAMVIHRANTEDLEPVDLRLAALQIMEETENMFEQERGRIRLDLPEDEVPCLGDMFSLVEAGKNLLVNALRYGAPPVALGVARQGGQARLCVRDQGAGIPESDWPDAGTRYARRSGAAPDSAGLGLAIVHAVAGAHNGRLEFRKLEGAGFEAAIALPCLTS